MSPHSAAAQEALEFRDWLKTNDRRLRHYAPDEIARLAVICGFSLEVACPSICDRTNHIGRLMAFWESPLAEYWLELVDYESGIERDAL